MADSLPLGLIEYKRSAQTHVGHRIHAALAGYFSLGIPRAIREFKPDVIHYTYSEWWGANLNTYLVSRRPPHVLSTFFHALPRAISTRPLFAVNRWLVPRMDAVHVVSDLERQQVHRVYGAPLERTVAHGDDTARS